MSRYALSKVACSHGAGPGSLAMVEGFQSKAAVEAAVPEQEATQVPVLEEVEERSAPERVVDCVRYGIRSSSSSSSWFSAAERAAERGRCGSRTRRRARAQSLGGAIFAS